MLSGSSVSTKPRTCIGVTEDTFKLGYLETNENLLRVNKQQIKLY